MMSGFVLFTMIVVIVVIVLLFVHDSRRARGVSSPRTKDSVRPAPTEATVEDPLDEVDVEALAEHVKGLRQAIDDGLIGRDEAIASIIRQADGRVSEGFAERLLDSAEME